MAIFERVDFPPEWNQLCPEWVLDPDAPPPVRRWEFSAPRHEGACGSTITVTAKLFDHDVIVDGETAKLAIQRDFHPTEFTEVKSSAAGLKIPVTLDRPGFVRIGLSAGETWGFYGIGFDVAKIEPAPEHPDFDAYWQRELARLDADPIKILSTQSFDFPDYPDVETTQFEISCAGEIPVSILLSKPKGAPAKSLPGYAFFHGAGVRPPFPPLPWARRGFLAINASSMGLHYGLGDDYLKEQLQKHGDYFMERSADPEKLPLNGVALRVIRALQYLKSRPEWNGRDLIVHGGSQGGWQSLVAAGLDHDVTFAQIEAAAACDMLAALDGRTPSWPKTVLRSEGRSLENTNFGLLDGVAFGRRAKAKAVFTVGYSDDAAVPSSIYAAYNCYGGPADLWGFTDLGHDGAVFWSGDKPILAAAGMEKKNR